MPNETRSAVQRGWAEWKYVVVTFALCLVASLLNARAWHIGHEANAIGLLGCHAMRAVVLLLAWWVVVAAFLNAAGKVAPPEASGFTVLHGLVLGLVAPACIGCHSVWPFVLGVLALVLLAARRSPHDTSRPPWWRHAVVVLLFVLTWYLCASTTRQAYVGLGERIEARCGSDRLLKWADEVIAAHQPGRLAPDELPDFIVDLLGPGQGVRGVFIRGGDEPYILLYTGGSAYHFEIIVCPARAERPPASWWWSYPTEWRPGVELGTGGK